MNFASWNKSRILVLPKQLAKQSLRYRLHCLMWVLLTSAWKVWFPVGCLFLKFSNSNVRQNYHVKKYSELCILIDSRTTSPALAKTCFQKQRNCCFLTKCCVVNCLPMWTFKCPLYFFPSYFWFRKSCMGN